MDNLARNQRYEDVQHLYGTVTSQNGSDFAVSTEHLTYTARQAVSCLFKPQAGDRVLLAARHMGDCYILAILERTEKGVLQAEMNGPMHLKVRNGRLKITSQEGIDMASAKDIRTISEKIHLNAVSGRFSLHDLFYQGSFLNARIGRLKLFAQNVDSVMERLNQKVKRLYRTVEEFEQVTAGRVDYLVKKLLSFRSRYTVMTSKEDVKVDGERIHIG